MEDFKPETLVEQLAAHIRTSITNCELSDKMPGVRNLAKQFGVSPNTVIAAVEQLEREGYLIQQGHGRKSLITLPEGAKRLKFKVSILPYEHADAELDYVVEIQRRLREKGYDVEIAQKSLMELGLKTTRVARMVNASESDAWVVLSSTQEVLQWFLDQSLPTFALFGRFRRLPIAASGLDKVPAFRAAIKRLAELGHRRIVLLQPDHNRLPSPALLIRETFQEMEALGIETSVYNLPNWKQSPEGLRKCLDSLFAVSPPTALILDRPNELIGAQHYLARKGIFAPQDISLLCDDDEAFEWCEPSVSCIHWKSEPWVRRVVKWVNNVSIGKEDLRQSFTRAEFIEKDTIGKVPGKKQKG